MGNKTIERKYPQTELDKMLSRFQIVQHDYNKNLVMMEEISTGKQFTLRQITTNDEIQRKKIQQLIQQKLATKYKYLWKLESYLIQKQKSYCSNQFNAYLLFQTPVKDLKQQILERRMKKVQFQQSQIMNVLQSGLLALKYLYTINHPHQAICSSNILINKQGSVMLSDPWLNPQNLPFPSMNHIYLSPQKLAQINNESTDKIDWFLSDLFSLGMVILQMTYLQFMDEVYIRNNKQINMNLLNEKINKIKFPKIKKYVQGILSNCKNRIKIVKQIQENDNKLKKFNNRSTSKDESTRNNDNQSFVKIKIISNQKNTTPRQNLKQKTEIVNNNLSVTSKNYQNVKVESKNTLKTQHQSISQNNTYFLSDHQSISSQKKLFSEKSNNVFNQQYKNNNKFILNNNNTSKASQNSPFKSNQQVKFNFIKNKPSTIQNSQDFGSQYRANINPPTTTDINNFRIDRKVQNPVVNITHRPNSQTLSKPNNITNIYTANMQQYRPNHFLNQFQNNIYNTKKQIIKPAYTIPIYPNQYNHQINVDIRKNLMNINHSNNSEINTNPVNNQININPLNNQLNRINVIEKDKQPIQSIGSNNKHNTTNNFQEINQQQKIKNTENQEQKITNAQNINTKQQPAKKNQYQFEDNNIIDILKQQKQLQLNQSQNIKSSNNKQQQLLNVQQPKFNSKQKYNSIINQVSQKSHTSASSIDNQVDYVIQEYQIGSKYQGYKKNGYRNGKGIFYYQDGGYYDGQWKDNKMNGYGKLYYNSQKLAYEGEWSMDFFNGYGKLYNDSPLKLDKQFNYENFDDLEEYWQYYQGNLVLDTKEGFGTIKISNGQMYIGQWKQNRIEGKGKFIKLNGETINGIWKNFKLIKKL